MVWHRAEGWLRGGLVCKVQERFRRFRGARFKAGSGGFGVAWCRPGVRFKEGSGGGSRKVVEVLGWSGQARCKVEGRLRRFRDWSVQRGGLVRARTFLEPHTWPGVNLTFGLYQTARTSKTSGTFLSPYTWPAPDHFGNLEPYTWPALDD